MTNGVDAYMVDPIDPQHADEAFATLDVMSRAARREAIVTTAETLECSPHDLVAIVARPGTEFGLALSLAIHDGTDPLIDGQGKAVPHLAVVHRDAALRLLGVEFPRVVDEVREAPPGVVPVVLVLDDNLARVVCDDFDTGDDQDDAYIIDGPDDPWLELYRTRLFDEPDDPPGRRGRVTTTAAQATLALQRHALPVVSSLVRKLAEQGRAHEVVVVVASMESGTAQVLVVMPWAIIHTDNEVLVAVWSLALTGLYLRSCPESLGVLSRVQPGQCAIMIATAGAGDTDRVEVVRRQVPLVAPE